MDDLEKLGFKIRGRREKRGLKQADIANALQITAQAVSKWERGENAPDIALLGPLAKMLGVSIDWLLGLHDGGTDVFEATVFVSSVQGYAKKALELDMRALASWANRFFYGLTEVILQSDGVPVKQMGDGLLCFFSGLRHRERAVTAAINARETMEEDIGVALATGEIYLGSIGHPDYERLDIMGDTVNVAFGILEGGQIVADKSVVEGIEMELELIGPVEKELKFVRQPVTLYTIGTAKR